MPKGSGHSGLGFADTDAGMGTKDWTRVAAAPVLVGVPGPSAEPRIGDAGASRGEPGDEKANTCLPGRVSAPARSTANNARNARPTADLAFPEITIDPHTLATYR